MRSLAAALISLSILSIGTAALAGEDVTVRTKSLIATFKKVKTAPEGKALSPADKSANQAVFKELDPYFDFDALTTNSLAPHKDKLSPEQYAKLKTMFGELIRLVAYPNSGVFFNDAEYTIKPGKPEGKQVPALMHAALKKEDFETDVIFHWQDQGGTLRLSDVSIDGSSLVRDYANQFGRIIAKDGAPGLVKKLETRLAKEQTK